MLELASGARIETPILVPSVSSRGFPLLDNGTSEARIPLEMYAPMIPDALLISAYDLAYDLIPGLDGMSTYPPQGVLSNPEALFIDSGGYETQSLSSGEPNRYALSPQPWDLAAYQGVLDRIDLRVPVVIVNLESRGPLASQVAAARALFDQYPGFSSDFLLKPSKSALFVSHATIAGQVRDMQDFDIIGVTEKELGTSLVERLVTIATVRSALDDAGLSQPLHIFGSLDPLLSVIYWMAGAEIFDGLTWITMAYDPDLYVTIYADALPVREGNWTQHEMSRRASIWANNLTVRERVMLRMKEFAVSGSFYVFGPNAKAISESVTVAETRLLRVRT